MHYCGDQSDHEFAVWGLKSYNLLRNLNALLQVQKIAKYIQNIYLLFQLVVSSFVKMMFSSKRNWSHLPRYGFSSSISVAIFSASSLLSAYHYITLFQLTIWSNWLLGENFQSNQHFLFPYSPPTSPTEVIPMNVFYKKSCKNYFFDVRIQL